VHLNFFVTGLSTNRQEFITYGFGEQNCWRASGITTNVLGGSDFSVLRYGEKVCEVSLPLPGHHNILNALAAFVTTLTLSKTRAHLSVSTSNVKLADESSSSALDEATLITRAVTALAGYQGIARRMQHVCTVGSCTVYDDYAHHPTAIRAVIGAMRHRFADARLVVAFQPHTYSRTAALLHDFADALSHADRVIITAVYDARSEARKGTSFSPQVSGQDIARLIGKEGVYCESLLDTTRQLVLEAQLIRARRGEYAPRGLKQDVSVETQTNAWPTRTAAETELLMTESSRTVFLCLGAGSSNQLAKLLHMFLLRP
jgi:UDP-N-acetylmuramate-alanine ligase